MMAVLPATTAPDSVLRRAVLCMRQEYGRCIEAGMMTTAFAFEDIAALERIVAQHEEAPRGAAAR